MHTEMQGNKNSQNHLKMNKVVVLTLPNFKTYFSAKVIETLCY